MNLPPSQSRGANSLNYGTPKMSVRKTLIPNLSASRKREVKTEENEEAMKKVSPFSAGSRNYFPRRKILHGSKTFAGLSNTSSSDIVVEGRPTINDSTSSNFLDGDKAIVCSNQSSNEDRKAAKVCTSRFPRICPEYPSDQPISIPRPRLFSSNNVIDFSYLNQGESSIFILKTPKYLPGVLSDLMKSQASSSKNESQKCTLSDLPESQIGTLQIMKSNRLRLVLGECAFWLYRGIPVQFKEELVFVNADSETKTGEMVNVGNIKGRIIAVPESVTTATTKNVENYD